MSWKLTSFLSERILPNIHAFWRDRQLLMWLLAVLTGVVTSYAAIGFYYAIQLAGSLWLGTASEHVYALASGLSWWKILLTPTAGGLLVGLYLHYIQPGRRTYGVADVIKSQAIDNCQMPFWRGIGSSLVTVVSLGFGASAGREGPVVHLGATLAAAVCRFFHLPQASVRTLLGCGVAAAVSASFNAPIAGFLFAHEVILGHYALRAVVPVTMASVTGALIAKIHVGDFVAFIVPKYEIISYLEFPAFAVLGMVCALVAVIFQFTLVWGDNLARQIRMPLWLRPVTGGLLIGSIAVFFPQVLSVGYDTTDMALKQMLPLSLLLTLLFLKIIATSITLACRFGGGVFSPSLYIGAMTGGAFGLLLAMFLPHMVSSHGLYAMVGMGAVAAAVLGAPVSTALIALELTGNYQAASAVLLAVAISVGINQAIHGRSFFHWQLNIRGIFLQDGPHRHILHRLCVRNFMDLLDDEEDPYAFEFDENVVTLKISDTVEKALRAFDASGHLRLAVINNASPPQQVGWAEHIKALDAFNTALIEANEERHR
jgi:CIC family chloride channel protein